MIALANMLITPIEDIAGAITIEVMWNGRVGLLFGPIVTNFVTTVNDACMLFPGIDCLAGALEQMPSEMRPVFEFLYEELKEVIK